MDVRSGRAEWRMWGMATIAQRRDRLRTAVKAAADFIYRVPAIRPPDTFDGVHNIVRELELAHESLDAALTDSPGAADTEDGDGGE